MSHKIQPTYYINFEWKWEQKTESAPGRNRVLSPKFSRLENANHRKFNEERVMVTKKNF